MPRPLETLKRKRAGSYVSISDGDSDSRSIITVASVVSPIGIYLLKVVILRLDDDDDGDTITISYVPPPTRTGFFTKYAKKTRGQKVRKVE